MISNLFYIFSSIQNKLFLWLEEALDPLSEKEQKFVQVLSLMNLEIHMKAYRRNGKGRKRKSRISISTLVKKYTIKTPLYRFKTLTVWRAISSSSLVGMTRILTGLSGVLIARACPLPV